MHRVHLHLLRLHLHLPCLRLHLRHLQLRVMEAALRGEELARELLAVALGAVLHFAEVLAQVIELRGHGADLVLQLAARRRVPALDAGDDTAAAATAARPRPGLRCR